MGVLVVTVVADNMISVTVVVVVVVLVRDF